LKDTPSQSAFSLSAGIILFLISTATLAYEINLTRLLSVTQFYHFAFMIVSIALLGFGASGTLLASLPGLGQRNLESNLGWLALASGVTMLGAYLLTNWLPFDSFSIAWDRRQVLILVLHYFVLTMPFFFSGLTVSLLLTAHSQSAGKIYSINLLGSSVGCLAALFAPTWIGGEGMISLSSAFCVSASLTSIFSHLSHLFHPGKKAEVYLRTFTSIVLILLICLDLVPRLLDKPGLPVMSLRLSPYKSLSYALQYPGAKLIYQRWNAFSRVDVVRSPGIRSLPGLSYRYLQPLPSQDGLLVDGNDLTPIVRDLEDTTFASYLPLALAFQLRPQANTLVLEARGGVDILVALAEGASHITAVEVNPLIVEAAATIYRLPGVETAILSDRAYLRRTTERFDVIILSLVNSYHPVRSGAYSLAEDYRYTVEAFQDAIAHLTPEGLLVVTRWHQSPPSEALRAFATAVTVLKRRGANPKEQMAVLRGYNAVTLFVKNGPFSPMELKIIRKFAAERAFDLDYLPDLHPQEVNIYNILPEPQDYLAYTDLLNAPSPEDYYAKYPFDVSPPTDDRPFFGHFFKWSQTREVMAELGKTWQPFGGAGYFVILALLILAILAAGVMIVLPALVFRQSTPSPLSVSPHSYSHNKHTGAIVYFGLLGLAFLLVEIPLIQRFILYLDNAAYAMTSVLFALLFFSGVGSRFSQRLPLVWALGLLTVLLIATPYYLPYVLLHTLGLPIEARLILTILILAPLGLLMGMPFPSGIHQLANYPGSEALVPWAWAVNGALSVISAVLAALIALSWGFTWVFRLGALCYAGAWLMARGTAFPASAQRRGQ